MTHAELVERAERWLRNTKKCGVVLTERGAHGTHEIPDAIGWRLGFWSILVECKTSRSDFHRDRKKLSRRNPDMGPGQIRYYMAPEGLLQPEEIPDGWGLLEIRGRTVRERKTPTKIFKVERTRYELVTLVAFARRTQLGLEPTAGILGRPRS